MILFKCYLTYALLVRIHYLFTKSIHGKESQPHKDHLTSKPNSKTVPLFHLLPFLVPVLPSLIFPFHIYPPRFPSYLLLTLLFYFFLIFYLSGFPFYLFLTHLLYFLFIFYLPRFLSYLLLTLLLYLLGPHIEDMMGL